MLKELRSKLQQEKNELEVKRGNLFRFIKKYDDGEIENFIGGEENLVLLRLQEDIMESYIIILDRRIKILTSEIEK
jgi:ribosomal protein L10